MTGAWGDDGRDDLPEVEERAPAPMALTAEEKKVLNHLVDAWNDFYQLPNRHPSDAGEFQFHIHALQHIIASRVAKRCDPDVWR